MTVPDEPTQDPLHPRRPVAVVDPDARKAARVATILAALATVLAIVALIIALVHNHDYAPQNCDISTDYVCASETATP
jgi:hypothetical protein